MALALVPARSSQRDAVVKRDIIADLGRLADDDSRAVIYEKAATYGRSGMNVDIGPKPH